MSMRKVSPKDRSTLLEIATATRVFDTSDEVELILGSSFDGILAGKMPTGQQAHVLIKPNDTLAGWVYFGPQENSLGDNVWELFWIGVHPNHQRGGSGAFMLSFVEKTAAMAGARMLIINTSSGNQFEKARSFYAKQGYQKCGQIPDFYTEGQDQMTFVKKINASFFDKLRGAILG